MSEMQDIVIIYESLIHHLKIWGMLILGNSNNLKLHS